ncbi:MAG: pyridoxal phosphate-dependent aminotransferase [Candidatus Omnitrophica bacterium]|nr:pyridoxal phosphate-dependent aminotransferase [Candidatus Omnitrophota bacterium]
MFAQRTAWQLSSNKITQVLTQLRESGEEILDLTESNPTRCGFSYPSEEIMDALQSPCNLEYRPSSQGLLSAREAVCAYYQRKNVEITPDQVFLTASTSEAYSFLFRLLANPGEEILFPRPGYPLFEFLIDLNDLKWRTFPLVYKEGWHVDLEGLASEVSEQTRAVVLVNPNNPTGSFIDATQRETINKICGGKIPIICDEVFEDYVFDEGLESFSLVNNQENLTFVLGGLSKTLALPQMKVSWIVVSGPKDDVQESIKRLEIIADTYLSVNTPAQNALPKWLGLRNVIQKDILTRVRQNRDLILGQASSHLSCRVLDAQGGWYVVLKVGQRDEEQFVLNLLEQDHVFVHPGYFFDFPDEGYIVLSLLPLSDVFEKGVTRILNNSFPDFFKGS